MENCHTLQFKGMGSQIKVWLQHDNEARAHQLLRQTVRLFSLAETRFSRFISYSELTELNNRSGEWIQVSDQMFEIICRAIALAHETDGLFDPTQLRALEQMGYGRSFTNFAPNAQTLHSKQAEMTYQDIELDPLNQRIKAPKGLWLDFGGIGKGFTSQKAVSFLQECGPCLIDAGGDLTAGDAPEGLAGWPVSIASPGQGDQPDIAKLFIANQTLATSGVDFRHWEQNGNHRHHIIDPRTAVSAQTDTLSVSVIADDACAAEAWATAGLVVGFEAGFEMLTAVDLQALLVHKEHHLLITPKLQAQVQLLEHSQHSLEHLSRI